MKRRLLILMALINIVFVFAFTTPDSLLVQGRVMLDSTGMADVSIAGVKTDSSGYYAFKMPVGIDTTLVPHRYAFLFSPAEYHISSEDTLLDSINFLASRQIKKTIIISGQSNAEHVGEPKYFISDDVDNNIPYYLAYSGGEFGLSTLGMLTKFGYSTTYCEGYNKGFGLEMLLARTLYKKYTDSLAVMKAPYSGTSLDVDWKPDGATWQWFTEKHDNAVELYRNKGYEPEYIGFFWFQGESDEFPLGASHYPANLRTFVDRIRARFPNSSEADNLPFICVQINWNPDSPYEDPIRAAQMDIGNQREDCACVDIDDCSPYRYSSKNTHFSGGALNRIGFKMAAQYMEMLGTPLDSSVSILVNMDEMLDTTIVLHCEGDTTFDYVMTDLEFEFPAKIGDQFTFSLNLDSDTYNYSPATRSTPFAYPQLALTDPSFTFNVNKVVAIEDYPQEIDYVTLESYPNPFNPTTAINFTLPAFGNVELSIYDILGRKIQTVIDMPMEAGNYRADWNASAYPSGLYIARLQVGGEMVTKKLVLLK